MVEKKQESIFVERHPYAGLVIYEVAGEDLDQLEKETLSVGEDFTFSVFCLSVAVSFTTTLAATKIESIRVFNVFWIVTLLGYLGGTFFGIRWFHGRKRHKSIVRRIKERVGPLGDESKEIGPGELAALPEQKRPSGQETK